jgi:hypothetical protein
MTLGRGRDIGRLGWHLRPRRAPQGEGKSMNTQTRARREDTVALYALFAEPCRGTHASGAAVLLLGIRVDPQQVVKILVVDAEDQPRWFGLDEVTFDWRSAPNLQAWARRP